MDEVDELRALEAQIAERSCAADDVAHLAEAMETGQHRRGARVGNRGRRRSPQRPRRAGGQLVATGRIPIQAILASLEAENDDTMTEGV